jgi:mannose-6-phosphate isomerase-like protein (cupin superfamily)
MKGIVLVVGALIAFASNAAGQVLQPTVPPQLAVLDNSRDDARTILDRYAAAWRGDQFVLADTMVFGFRIRGEGGGEYHAVLAPDGTARLNDGPAEATLPFFETDITFLRRLDRGDLNALTAMGQARPTDPVPLIPRFPPGFRWTPETQALYMPLAFHFWNREHPKIVRFGEGTTRLVHGGNATVLFYTAGLRTAWYQIEPGMHINAEADEKDNPFPTLIIMTRGIMQAQIDGEWRLLSEGEAVYIPARMTHEFRAGPDQYGEFIIIMYGEGA